LLAGLLVRRESGHRRKRQEDESDKRYAKIRTGYAPSRLAHGGES
jgi:hypothetical protein